MVRKNQVPYEPEYQYSYKKENSRTGTVAVRKTHSLCDLHNFVLPRLERGVESRVVRKRRVGGEPVRQ